MQYLDLQELAEELQALETELAAHDDPEAGHADPSDWADVCPICDGGFENGGETSDRYKALKELDSDLNGLAEYGRNEPTAIAEDDFEDYAEELARDIGAISGDEGWPLMFIDWSAAAEALKVDYEEFTFEGTTYLIRTY
jgi:hypothetical protein